MPEWKMPEIEMQEAVEQLSPEGKKEWELAAARAVINKLSEECESLHNQVAILEKQQTSDAE